jgi:hypothetical protein
MATFIARKVKASWGFACNQNADGDLWAGKGYEKRLSGQLGKKADVEILAAITTARGNRCGRFWVDMESLTITMAVGISSDNEYEQVTF